ncbi:ribonuclease H-like domain-containing protein [Tanacetum coccineum]
MAIGEPFGSVELINNHDAGNPLYLQSNDNYSLAIVNLKLVGAKTYKMWATAIKIALKEKNKMIFIDGTCVKQKTSVVLSQQWKRLISHTVDRCYELNGYPVGFKRNLNLSKQSRNNNNNKRFNGNSEVNHSLPSTSGSLSSSFINEQMMKLLSLINEKPSLASKYVMYNVTLVWIINSGANQHMTDSTKDMFNIIDISSLMLTVGHPNGTLAKITTIGSLRLTSGIVLFDVLVVPEYNDLNLGKIIGTGSETGGLYLFDLDKIGKCVTTKSNSMFVCHVSSKLWHCRLGHPADQVLSILGDNVTSEGSVQTNQNGEGPSNILETSPILRRSTRQKTLPSKLNDYIVSSNVKYGLKKYVCYANLSSSNLCFSTTLNKSSEPKTFHEASQNLKWVKAMNLKMEALHRNNTYVLADLSPGRKVICKNDVFIAILMYVDDIVKCCLELLNEYGLLACKPTATSLQRNVVLNHEESDNVVQQNVSL